MGDGAVVNAGITMKSGGIDIVQNVREWFGVAVIICISADWHSNTSTAYAYESVELEFCHLPRSILNDPYARSHTPDPYAKREEPDPSGSSRFAYGSGACERA